MTTQPSDMAAIVQKNILIPMRDGVEVAADLYRPPGSEPLPVILSVYPYHKDGMVGAGNQNHISYFVRHGYAYVMADCRGTGSSGGVSTDPLDGLNADDLYELVEWIARQPWCNGFIGMTGMSYGGMTALKAASVRPPHLKAILPIMAPSAFYHNLAFPGGAFNMLGLCGAWCGLMHCMNLMPPFYQDPDGRWEKVWKEHLDTYVPYLIGPLEHMTYDDYWKAHDIKLEEVEVPIYVIEGWHDFALIDGIRQYTAARGPKKLLVGPWIHFNLDLISLEPFDYLHEMRRWFDYWLKGEDTGIMDEPSVAICIQGTSEWRFEGEWPVPTSAKRWNLAKAGALSSRGTKNDFSETYSIEPAVGTRAGLMTVMPLGIDYPRDQKLDDALSLSFDSAPLKADLDVVGEPICKLFVSSSGSDFNLVTKICDVAPDGTSALVTTGWRRGSHHTSYQQPTTLQPAKIYEFEVKTRPTAYCFRAGHRIRLSISCSDFPRIWPVVEHGEVTFHGGPSHPAHLILPVVRRKRQAKTVPSFQPPDLAYLMESPRIWLPHWRVIEDHANKCLSVESGVHVEFQIPTGGEFKLTHSYRASLRGEKLRYPDLEVETTCEATVEGRIFNIRVDSQMTPSRIEVNARVLRDLDVVFQKAFAGNYKM
ncbi:MAG: CocE/NonD family hydrolase [Candidatus Abyssobacteria bacterium SURF_17]|uniref:CocE/NonD family hydrolase n=1 Tax=Candidatus Abyssobacteria bacterium SURF_17 TaxID=2093361 RepID=A0A419EX89_9BACT|nr:MAG: CocE/NonD family hydrolase [Candidatus Abyssubacteria bacterium SURF_17]